MSQCVLRQKKGNRRIRILGNCKKLIFTFCITGLPTLRIFQLSWFHALGLLFSFNLPYLPFLYVKNWRSYSSFKIYFFPFWKSKFFTSRGKSGKKVGKSAKKGKIRFHPVQSLPKGGPISISAKKNFFCHFCTPE